MSDNKYLPHIEGLRAWAIVMVALFHLNGEIWPNGYLGVDVFLVITGFLLFRGRMKNDGLLTIADAGKFAWRRVSRIMPSMLIVIILTVLLGAFLLWCDDESFLCRVANNACMIKVNMLLAREFENYFAPDSAFIPLLHLWYLAVVLQMYLIWIVGNLILQKFSKRMVMSILVIVSVMSLLYRCSSALHDWLEAAGAPVWEEVSPVSYYSTLPRLWEMLAGGLALLLPLPSAARRVKCTALSLVGLLGIVCPCLAGFVPGLDFVSDLPCVMIVVASTVLVIRYLPESNVAICLTNKLLVWLGSISFSLYLVHMPVIVFGHLWVYGNHSMLWYEAALLAGSLLLAWGYWWAVEKRRFSWWLIILLWSGAYMFSKYGRITGGFKNYLPVQEAKLEIPTYPQWQRCELGSLLADMPDELNAYPGFFYHGPQAEGTEPPPRMLFIGKKSQRPNVLFMGDSHADHFYAGMDVVFKHEGWTGVYLASIVYPFHGRQRRLSEHYRWDAAKGKALMKWLSAHPELECVVIAQWWLERFKRIAPSVNAQDLRLFLSDIKAMGKKIVLIADTPEFDADPLQRYVKIYTYRGASLGDHAWFSSTCTPERHRERHAGVYAVLEKMEQEGLCKVVDPLKGLAPGEVFHSVRGNTVLMRDDNHMNPGMSIDMGMLILPQLRALIPCPVEVDE